MGVNSCAAVCFEKVACGTHAIDFASADLILTVARFRAFAFSKTPSQPGAMPRMLLHSFLASGSFVKTKYEAEYSAHWPVNPI